jgi:hypothetical protein
MVDSAIPRVEDAVTAALNALIAARPTALTHLDNGKYGNVVTGWRAQEAVLVQRIADEVRASRIATSFGQALRDLASSEFSVQPVDGAVAAIGTFTFTKSVGAFATGVIKRGTRIRRIANPSVFPQQKDATYQTLDDVYVPAGATTVVLNVQAAAPGAASNVTPTDGSGTPLTIAQQFAFADPVYDTTYFTSASNTITVDIGGGSDGIVDDDVKRLALSVGIGQFGPLLGALITGALAGRGVKRAATYEDPTTGIATVFAADGSFHGSSLWASSIRQSLFDGAFVGFGCGVGVRPATLTLVAVQATIVLRDGSYLPYTVDIGNNVRAALNSYFSNRPDWYSFKLAAIRAAIAGADKRILTCPLATVTAPGTGVAFLEPTAFTSAPATLSFWSLSNNGLSATYTTPS